MSTSQISSFLELDSHLSILPGGSHANVIVSGDKVIKIIADNKKAMSESVAHNLAQAMQRYDELLRAVGLNTPTPMEIKVIQNQNTGIWTIIQRAPYVGQDLGIMLRKEEAVAFERSVDAILSALRPVLRAISNGRTRIGIDPKPANFTRDEQGTIFYVDMFPPRYIDEGARYVEYPEPETAGGQEIAYFRHFEVRGILSVLIGQITRLRPEFWFEIKPKIWALAKEFGVWAWFKESMPEKFQQANKAGKRQIIYSMTQRDMYDIRLIACELVAASKGFYTSDDLDRVFHLTHFADGLSADKVNQMQLVLIKMMESFPLDMPSVH